MTPSNSAPAGAREPSETGGRQPTAAERGDAFEGVFGRERGTGDDTSPDRRDSLPLLPSWQSLGAPGLSAHRTVLDRIAKATPEQWRAVAAVPRGERAVAATSVAWGHAGAARPAALNAANHAHSVASYAARDLGAKTQTAVGNAAEEATVAILMRDFLVQSEFDVLYEPWRAGFGELLA